MRVPVTEKEALDWIEKLTEKNELIATRKVELEAVKSERDYLRSVVANHQQIIIRQPATDGNAPYLPWVTTTTMPPELT